MLANPRRRLAPDSHGDLCSEISLAAKSAILTRQQACVRFGTDIGAAEVHCVREMLVSLLEVAAQDQDERVVLVATKLTTASGGWAASGAADFRSLTYGVRRP